MPSPARAHFQRTTAALSAAVPAAPATPAATSLHALLQAHRMALKGIQSLKAKIAAKAGYLPQYADYVAGLLDAGTAAGHDAELLLTVMVWRLDTTDWPGAMDIARLALKLKLALPERFDRSLPCFLVEQIAEALLAAAKAGQDPGADAAAALSEAMDLTIADDMPDEVRAKAHKALGLAAKDADPVEALRHLRAALSYDANSGVKTEIARLEKALAAPGATAEPAVLSPPPSA